MGCDTKIKEEKGGTVTDPKTTKIKSEDLNSTKKEKKPLKFTLRTIDDKEIHVIERKNGLIFQEFKDRPIFLIFFGYRCPPCIREIPVLIELTKEHKDLAIIAIEVQGFDNEELKAFKEIRGINYNLISSERSLDFVSYIQVKADWRGSIPFFLGLKKDGEVSIIHVGGVSKSALEGAYRNLVGSKE